jgi:hypothetical protein
MGAGEEDGLLGTRVQFYRVTDGRASHTESCPVRCVCHTPVAESCVDIPTALAGEKRCWVSVVDYFLGQPLPTGT